MDLEKNKQRLEILAAEVEELKNNGGGETVDAYTKEEADDKFAEKATTYTKTEVDEAIAAAGGGDLIPTYFGTAVPTTLSDEQYAIIQKHLPISTGSTEATATTVFSFLGENNNSYWYGYTTGNASSRIIYQTLLYISKSNNYTFTLSRSALYTNDNAAKEICDVRAAEEISANYNLDNNLAPGIFYANETIAATLTNCPTTDAFKLFVDSCWLAGSRLIQRLYTCSAIPVVYIRTRFSGTWTAWYKFEGTIVS